jgi:hypothetical protein
MISKVFIQKEDRKEEGKEDGKEVAMSIKAYGRMDFIHTQENDF